MIDNELSELLKSKKITRTAYLTYLVFMSAEVGREFLKNQLEGILMEEPALCTQVNFAWHDGRRSCWRDIKVVLNTVEAELENLRKSGEVNA